MTTEWEKLREQINLTDEEKCQLFLMDFEATTLKRRGGHLVSEWKPNDWGIKLLEFIRTLAEQWAKENNYVKLADDCPECGGTGNGRPTLQSPDGFPCETCQSTGRVGEPHLNRLKVVDLPSLLSKLIVIRDEEQYEIWNGWNECSTDRKYAIREAVTEAIEAQLEADRKVLERELK